MSDTPNFVKAGIKDISQLERELAESREEVERQYNALLVGRMALRALMPDGGPLAYQCAKAIGEMDKAYEPRYSLLTAVRSLVEAVEKINGNYPALSDIAEAKQKAAAVKAAMEVAK